MANQTPALIIPILDKNLPDSGYSYEYCSWGNFYCSQHTQKSYGGAVFASFLSLHFYFSELIFSVPNHTYACERFNLILIKNSCQYFREYFCFEVFKCVQDVTAFFQKLIKAAVKLYQSQENMLATED